jgi:transposase
LAYSGEVIDLTGIKKRFSVLSRLLDERSRRLVAGAESLALERGGISAVSRATGMSRPVIRQGIAELKNPETVLMGRVRRPGGGRKRIAERDTAVVRDLEKLVEPVTRGDPESPLRWTCKSVRRLAEELNRQGHAISYPVVAELLRELGYSLQANRKSKEGASHPDRNAQFEYISRKVKRFLAGRQPVISVDTKKKERWESSRTVGGNCVRAASRRRCVCMIF